MNCLIIEDEPKNILLIKKYNEMLGFNSFEVIDETPSVALAVKSFLKNKPDLILMDIHLADGTGFDFFENIQDYDAHTFVTIFITGYEQYAINAIKHAPVDYLVKPFGFEEFAEAIQKAAAKF